MRGTRGPAPGRAQAAAWRDAVGPAAPRVVLALPPGEGLLAVLYAGILGGCVVVPVAPPRPGAQADRFRHILVDCGAGLVLATEPICAAILRQMTDEGRLPPACPLGHMEAGGRPPSSRTRRAAAGRARLGPSRASR